MDHQTHSRYNTMPEYASDRLTVDIIEARLRAKFGNKKYFVEIPGAWKFWVPRDLTADEKILLRNPNA